MILRVIYPILLIRLITLIVSCFSLLFILLINFSLLFLLPFLLSPSSSFSLLPLHFLILPFFNSFFLFLLILPFLFLLLLYFIKGKSEVIISC